MQTWTFNGYDKPTTTKLKPVTAEPLRHRQGKLQLGSLNDEILIHVIDTSKRRSEVWILMPAT